MKGFKQTISNCLCLAILLVAASFTAIGCGNKGKLYLPTQATAQPETEADSKSNQEKNRENNQESNQTKRTTNSGSL